MPDFRAPRVRMPKVRCPAVRAPRRSRGPRRPRSSRRTGNGAKPAASKETKETAPKEPATAKPAATKAAAGAKAPEPNVQERMEGLQGWMAEIERKQGRMTYFGIAGVVIAILAAGAALYFGLTAKSDSATKGDLDALTKRIDALEAAATKNSKDTQAALNSSVSQLQQSIAAVQKQQAQNAASISTPADPGVVGRVRQGRRGRRCHDHAWRDDHRPRPPASS